VDLMAIDSVDKRRSMMGLDFEWAWYPPQADGLFSADDLRQWNLIYRTPLCFGLFDHAVPKTCQTLTQGDEVIAYSNPQGIFMSPFIIDRNTFEAGDA
jgi:hypothetical protein